MIPGIQKITVRMMFKISWLNDPLAKMIATGGKKNAKMVATSLIVKLIASSFVGFLISMHVFNG